MGVHHLLLFFCIFDHFYLCSGMTSEVGCLVNILYYYISLTTLVYAKCIYQKNIYDGKYLDCVTDIRTLMFRNVLNFFLDIFDE